MQSKLWLVALLGGTFGVVPGHRSDLEDKPAAKSTSARQKTETGTPSLADTQKWIKNTFKENTGNASCEEFDSSKPESETGEEFNCSYQRYLFDFDACRVTFFTLHSHRNHTLNRDTREWVFNDGEDEKENSVVHFNLADIDPKSILASEPRGAFGALKKKTSHDNSLPFVDICLETTDSANTITIRYSGAPFKIHKLCGLDNFVTAKPEYAPRFVKALSHAVELCGGKSSTF